MFSYVCIYLTTFVNVSKEWKTDKRKLEEVASNAETPATK